MTLGVLSQFAVLLMISKCLRIFLESQNGLFSGFGGRRRWCYAIQSFL